MTQATVKLSVSFEALVDSLKELDQEEKYRLWKLLEEQIGQLEEELLEKDGAVLSQIQEARAAYRAGDYETIDEYIARREKRTS